MIRLIYAIPSWLAFSIFRFTLITIGVLMVPVAVLFGAYDVKARTLYTGEVVPHYFFTWAFMWLWDNDEEGCAWYGSGPAWWRIIYSSCWRNPVNNLRYVPVLSLKIDPNKVEFRGSLATSNLCRNEHGLPYDQYYYFIKLYDSDDHNFWYFCWHGFYSNYRRHFTVQYRWWHVPIEYVIRFLINLLSLFTIRSNFTIAGRYRFWIGWKIYPEDIYGVTDHRSVSAGFANQLKKID